MNFLKNISAAFKTAGGAVQGAVKVVEEKNRRTALMNRLRTVIRCEEKAEERAYLALGRYYYHNLRDAENTVTEPYCIDIEAAQKRIDAAVEKLEALTREDGSEAEEEEITLDDVQEYTPTPEEEKEAEEARLAEEQAKAEQAEKERLAAEAKAAEEKKAEEERQAELQRQAEEQAAQEAAQKAAEEAAKAAEQAAAPAAEPAVEAAAPAAPQSVAAMLTDEAAAAAGAETAAAVPKTD